MYPEQAWKMLALSQLRLRINESERNLNNLHLPALKMYLEEKGKDHSTKEKADMIETYVFTDSAKALPY